MKSLSTSSLDFKGGNVISLLLLENFIFELLFLFKFLELFFVEESWDSFKWVKEIIWGLVKFVGFERFWINFIDVFPVVVISSDFFFICLNKSIGKCDLFEVKSKFLEFILIFLNNLNKKIKN